MVDYIVSILRDHVIIIYECSKELTHFKFVGKLQLIRGLGISKKLNRIDLLISKFWMFSISIGIVYLRNLIIAKSYGLQKFELAPFLLLDDFF